MKRKVATHDVYQQRPNSQTKPTSKLSKKTSSGLLWPKAAAVVTKQTSVLGKLAVPAKTPAKKTKGPGLPDPKGLLSSQQSQQKNNARPTPKARDSKLQASKASTSKDSRRKQPSRQLDAMELIDLMNDQALDMSGDNNAEYCNLEVNGVGLY